MSFLQEMVFFHLVKSMFDFPRLALKGIYHYSKYIFLFFQGTEANGGFDIMGAGEEGGEGREPE